MSFRSFAAAAMAAVLLGAAHKSAPLITYSAPAGDRPAGADNVHPTNAILPNGRIAAPSGASVFVGTTPLGMTLSPDGRYVVVTNGDDRTGGLPIPNTEPPPAIGYSLAVVDAQTMGLVSVYRSQGTFFMGVAAVRDPRSPGQTLVLASDGGAGALDVFRLESGGQLTPDGQPIALPPNALGHAFPAGIAVEPNGRYAYVADNLGGAIDVVDLNARASVRTLPGGNAPFDVAANGSHILASAAGLAAYHPLQQPAKEPQFTAPPFDAQRSSAVSVIDLAGSGDVAGDPAVVRMDPAPDGTQIVGGAAPGSIVFAPGGNQAYVALANVDRVAVVSLDAAPRVVRGLDLRLFPDAPFGAV
ncbi:MAG TPA: hypothetical protein VFE36_15215, partial [Candidatus Baltobacteraceae bacterium]|nr:hypothetical protein [Candidatus Baltobacteraceae bacterium]